MTTIYGDVKGDSQFSDPIFDIAKLKDKDLSGRKINVSPVVSELASWYEKFRNAVEYSEDEVLFRSAVERILRRYLLISNKGSEIAPSLVRELAWAKYLQTKSIPESLQEKTAERIDLYLKLYDLVKNKTIPSRVRTWDYIVQLMSVDLVFLLGRDEETEALAESFYRILKAKVDIPNIDKKDEEALFLLNVFKAFAKEDQPFLRYRLFIHYFGSLKENNLEETSREFAKIVQIIEDAIDHPLNNRVYVFAKHNTAPFLILKDILKKQGEDFLSLTQDRDRLREEIVEICEKRYNGLRSKVRRAIVRSTIFLLVTKAVIGLFVEGTFERLFYGGIIWEAIALNTAFPPLLLASSFFFINTPSQENTQKIIKRIESILFDPKVREIDELQITREQTGNRYLNSIFTALWIGVGIVGLMGIHRLLNILTVNVVSQIIFVFFLAIVLFLIYRIHASARVYNVEDERPRYILLLIDIIFMPFVHVGRRLTLTVSRLSIFLLIFDLLIETPFKTLFSFFEQWLFFLRTQREKLD